MHVLVIKESLYKEKPWIAENIYKASEEAKSWCLKQMRFSGAIRYMCSLAVDIDELDKISGSDPWPYGIEPNRKTLETLVRYLLDRTFSAGPSDWGRCSHRSLRGTNRTYLVCQHSSECKIP